MHFTGKSITDTLHKDMCLYLWKIKSLLREAPSLSEFNYEVYYKTVFVLLSKNTQQPRQPNSLLQVGFTTVAQGHFRGQVLSEEAYQFVQETTFS